MNNGISREFQRYTLASAFALAADMGLLALLVQVVKLHYLLAAAISFLGGTLISYLLCIRVVFKSRKLTHAAPEFGVFLAIGTVGLGLNSLAMAMGVELLGMHFLIAKTGAAGCTFLANFCLRKVLLFSSSEEVHSPSTALEQGRIP